MRFSLKLVNNLVEECLQQPWTGDTTLDALQDASNKLIGHLNPYYKLFYRIAQEFKPALVVELGSWRGYGAAHFAAGNSDGKVVTIDIHREDKEAQAIVRLLCERYRNMIYINAWTRDAVEDVKKLGIPIDVLYIDAWHEYEYAQREYMLYYPLMARNSLIICDDIFDDPSATKDMVKFWRDLPGDKFLNAGVHPGVPMGFLKVVKP